MVDRLLLQVVIAFPTEKPSPEQRRYELWIQAGAPMEIACREIEISHKQATLVCPLKAFLSEHGAEVPQQLQNWLHFPHCAWR